MFAASLGALARLGKRAGARHLNCLPPGAG